MQYITHAEDTMHMISKATVPGAFLCDFFPWSELTFCYLYPSVTDMALLV